MSDVIVIEANAQVALRNLRGEALTVTGVVAVERHLVAAVLERPLLRDVRQLARAPSEEEVHRSVRRGLVRSPERPRANEPAPVESDTRALTQLRKADLEAGARLLDLDDTGTRADLINRIASEAERHGVDTEGSGLQVIERTYARKGPS